MARRWLLLLAALGVVLLNLIVLATFWPGPSPPPTASPGERLYLAHCATCHGGHGNGSWRATLLLIRPGDLSDPRRMRSFSDRYLFDVVKQGGAPLGKPGMPAFGFHLSDAEIQDLIRYVRTLSTGSPHPLPKRWLSSSLSASFKPEKGDRFTTCSCRWSQAEHRITYTTSM